MTRRVVCLLFVVFSISALAGEEKKEKQNSLHKGAWAMQFEISGSLLNFKVNDYLGSTFSGKYHYADNRAWRFGLELNGYRGRSDIDAVDDSPSFAQTSHGNSTNSDHDIDFVLHHLWYVRENNGFHLNFGVGPRINLHAENRDDKIEHMVRLDSTTNSYSSGRLSRQDYFLGLSGSIGFEYFLLQNLSLMTEFQSNLGYQFSKYETTGLNSSQSDNSTTNREQELKNTDHGFKYYSSHVKVGVSVYF